MNTLRILPLALLLLPALAGADQACPPMETCFNVTGGSMVVNVAQGTFDIAGNGFSATAHFGPGEMVPSMISSFVSLPQGPHQVGAAFFSQEDLVTNLTIDGVAWTIGGDGWSDAHVYQMVDITGPGTYAGDFSFVMRYNGWPTTNVEGTCPTACQLLRFSGQGTYKLDVVYGSAFGAQPGSLQGYDQLTFNAPEPSTASLLLIGFAGLAVLCRRRRPRTP